MTAQTKFDHKRVKSIAGATKKQGRRYPGTKETQQMFKKVGHPRDACKQTER